MAKELRYRAFKADTWTLVKPEHLWNDTEREFVAIMDAAFPDTHTESGPYLEDSTVPGFGLKLVGADHIIYYAGDVQAATAAASPEQKKLILGRGSPQEAVLDWVNWGLE